MHEDRRGIAPVAAVEQEGQAQQGQRPPQDAPSRLQDGCQGEGSQDELVRQDLAAPQGDGVGEEGDVPRPGNGAEDQEHIGPAPPPPQWI